MKGLFMLQKGMWLVVVSLLLVACQEVDLKQENAVALTKAKTIFKEKMAEGIDMTAGPCLSNELMLDWVLDVAHNPREPEDDLPENQCSALRKGEAHHFVELDENGDLIKIQ